MAKLSQQRADATNVLKQKTKKSDFDEILDESRFWKQKKKPKLNFGQNV